MNTAVAREIVAALTLGQGFGGGFFVAAYMHGDERRGLIVAPKAEGELRDVRWHRKYNHVPGALSYFDGLANTRAMAEAGSELAQKAVACRIGGFDDWCIPAQDQLEPIYRLLKPSEEKNYCFARSGINLSALPPTWPYTPDFPKKTEIEIFRAGGAEAFETDDAYWTSTEHAGYSDYAWFQHFGYGYQVIALKDGRSLARFVRSVTL